MNLETMYQFLIAFAASVGGSGIIILTASKGLANLITKKIFQNNEYKLSRGLENYKSGLNKRNYVSKVRFDLEIETYRQLSGAFTKMVFDTYNLYPPVLMYWPVNIDDENVLDNQKQLFDKAIVGFELAKEALARNAPFIPNEKYLEYQEVLKLCAEQIFNYRYYEIIESDDENVKRRQKDKPDRREQLNKSIEINNKLTVLTETIRKQIADLEVI